MFGLPLDTWALLGLPAGWQKLANGFDAPRAT